ncbi:MAG: type IV secretory system conjugative DNA transfer family protein [Gammaproteobacteria bacterium]|nr:type IV secretory system conjugative DNA transfer family protein [Gammaproteobacteria bacterium]
MRLSLYLKLIGTIGFLAFMVGCADTSESKAPPSKIPAFESAQKFQQNHIRIAVIKDTARSVGAQAALAYSAKDMNSLLEAQNLILLKTFDFQQMMLPHNVMPPVLVESKEALNLDGTSSIRLADRIYKIEKSSHFVTTIPSWRDYLWMTFSQPDTPDQSLLPKSNQERDIWNKYIIIGWNEGIEQAYDIFNINLSRLIRDYQGMILYRKLLAQNIVTPPFISKADLGVTGGGNSLRINDQVLRITSVSQLKANSKEWKSRIYVTQPVNKFKSK